MLFFCTCNYRWLYWTDYYSSAPKISKMSMDGTERSIIHNTSLSTPYGLTLDYVTQTLYWTDYSLNKIEKSNVDGSNRTVVTTLLVNDPYSITFYNGSLYWTDLSYNRILTTAVDSADVTLYVGNAVNDMYGIKAIAEERQPLGITFLIFIHQNQSVCFFTVTNPCQRNNGNCSHFCFLSSTAVERYRCGCPDEMTLINDTTCERKYRTVTLVELTSVLTLKFYSIASPYLLFTRHHRYIQRVNLDGIKYRNLFSTGYSWSSWYTNVRALDFDLRYIPFQSSQHQ